MKKVIFSLAMISLLAACQSAPEGDKANVSNTQEAATAAEGNVFTVNTDSSSITFLGTKPVGTHSGVFKIKDGSFTANATGITSGKFQIDINSLSVLDNDTMIKNKLGGHLLSSDFFDAQKYPTASFELTGCTPLEGNPEATHTLSGNLTMKDSTKNVSFPAKIVLSEKEAQADASFVIDRTLWGLHYGNDKSLKDKFIYPEVKLTLHIKATH